MITRSKYAYDEDWAEWEKLRDSGYCRDSELYSIHEAEGKIAVTHLYDKIPLIVVQEKVDAFEQADRNKREQLYREDQERQASEGPHLHFQSTGRQAGKSRMAEEFLTYMQDPSYFSSDRYWEA